MGKAFAELQAWDQAIDSYRIAIGPPWELNPKNPVVHQEIVNVFELKGDKFAADAAAAELATRYAPGTPWYAANEKDREAMENQRRIAERALYAATRNTHSAATQLRKDYDAAGQKDRAAQAGLPRDVRARRSMLYRTFIETYPESDYVYEFTFLQGEALYWSERYLEAVTAYKWVRDHRDLGTALLHRRGALDPAVVRGRGAEAGRGRQARPAQGPDHRRAQGDAAAVAVAADPRALPQAAGRVRRTTRTWSPIRRRPRARASTRR